MLVAVAVLLGTMDLCSQARADDLQTAVTSFPRLRPEVYNPAVVARCANVLIQAGEQRACATLLEAVKGSVLSIVNSVRKKILAMPSWFYY